MKKTLLSTLVLGAGLALGCENTEEPADTYIDVIEEPDSFSDEAILPDVQDVMPEPIEPELPGGEVKNLRGLREFDDFIAGTKSMVDFCWSRDGICGSMASFVEQAAVDYNGILRVGYVDLEDSPEVFDREEVSDIPAFRFYELGDEAEIYRFEGPKTQEYLQLKVKEFCNGWVPRAKHPTSYEEYFNEVFNSGLPVMFEFTALGYCAACRAIEPRIELASIEYSDQVLEEDALKVVVISTEEQWGHDAFKEFDLRYVPSILFANGGQAYRGFDIIGSLEYEELTDKIDYFLNYINSM
ncbi:MAG: thioredoxin family protein [Candidatus Woesearchaeota archaeon]